MIETIELVITLPQEALNPNSSVGMWGKAKAKKDHKTEAWLVAMNWLNERNLDPPRWAAATIQCRFYFAKKRRRDKDNFAAAMKAAFDGIAQAGIVANDSGFTPLPVIMDIDQNRPRVVIEIIEQRAI